MNNKILILGATGMQGGAVANEALDQGLNVRILVRDINSEKVQSLVARGAEVVEGDFDNIDSLEESMKNISTVFSVPIIGMDSGSNDTERIRANTVIQSALKAGVKHFVQTSVAATGRYKSFPNWGTGYWYEKYWTDKWDIEEKVRNAGFDTWTILKPSMIMQNFIGKVDIMYPDLKNREIKTVTLPDKKMDFISVNSLAKFACESFKNTDTYNKKSIELASESISYNDIAKIFSDVLGKTIKITNISAEESQNQGNHIYITRAQEWDNVVGYNVDKTLLENYNIELESFREFVESNKDYFILD